MLPCPSNIEVKIAGNTANPKILKVVRAERELAQHLT